MDVILTSHLQNNLGTSNCGYFALGHIVYPAVPLFFIISKHKLPTKSYLFFLSFSCCNPKGFLALHVLCIMG